MFPGEQGGLWIHDVHGRVLFYDGQTTLPKSGSFLRNKVEQLAYHKGSFWTLIENEVYQTYPNQERRLVFSLNPGSQIRKIGSSGNYIWVSDGAQFYTYNVETSELNSFSLLQLYQHSNNSYVYINDAIFVETKWALATTSGVYLSEGSKFNHVVSSGTNYIEKVYYSHTRREILVGTLKGALIFNIYEPGKPVIRIGASHVLTFAETNQEYWVGTEQGLYLYSFLTGEVTQVTPASFLELELASTKIYSLLNDNMGECGLPPTKAFAITLCLVKSLSESRSAVMTNKCSLVVFGRRLPDPMVHFGLRTIIGCIARTMAALPMC